MMIKDWHGLMGIIGIMQTKNNSLIETLTNTSIGYLVALASQLLVFPMFDINIPFSDNLLIGLYFTIISICRGYVVRRVFNRNH
jgi:hypothetical protein